MKQKRSIGEIIFTPFIIFAVWLSERGEGTQALIIIGILFGIAFGFGALITFNQTESDCKAQYDSCMRRYDACMEIAK